MAQRELSNMPNIPLIAGDPNADRSWKAWLAQLGTRLILAGQIAWSQLTVGAGTSTQVLHGNASGDPTWGSVVLADMAPSARPNRYYSAVHG